MNFEDLKDTELEGISGGWGSRDDSLRDAESTQRCTRLERSAVWNPGPAMYRGHAGLGRVA